MPFRFLCLLAAFWLALSGCQSVPDETVPALPPVPETPAAEDSALPQPDLPPETDPVENLPEPYAAVHEYHICAADHPELDFSFHEEYQNYAVCDYAIAPNGNLLLLTLSESVTEIAPDGTLVGQYTYDFASHGLTAYMITCDEAGHFYFADGRNDAIIKASREEILHVSLLREGSGLPALTLSDSMYAREEDVLAFLNYNENFEFCIYTLHTDGEYALCPDPPVLGQSLGGGEYAVVSMVKNDHGDRTREFRLAVHRKNGISDYYLFHSDRENGINVYGMGLYGMIDGGTIVGYVREWTLDPVTGKEKSIQTKVKIDKTGITEITPDTENPYRLVRTYGGESYVLQRYENGIRVVPLAVLCTEEEWSSDHWFAVVHE